MERRSMVYEVISARGTSASMVVMPSSAGMEPIMVPRRLELMSPMMAPWYSSGMVTKSWPIGSRMVGLALGIPS